MKIAIDIRAAGGEKAGKGWYTFNLIRNLLKIDKKNQYILYSKSGIPGFQEFLNAKKKIIKGHSLFWHKKIAKDSVKEKADIFFSPTSYITAGFLPKHIKKIITVHDLVAFLFPSTHNKKAVFLEKIFLKKALKKTNFVLTVSKNTQKDLVDMFDYSKNKTKVIYCSAADDFKPVNREKLEEFKTKANLPDKFFLAVGTLEPRKNYQRLVKAFSLINEIHPEYHLIFAGKKGWGYENIFAEIRKHFLDSKIHHLGYLTNNSLNRLYNLARALVFPSLYEGFGIPPLEAMRCGCPVIASNNSSIPEVVDDNGLTIDPRNTKQIALAMKELIENNELHSDLKNKALTRSQKFSWKESAKELQEVFNRVYNSDK